MFLVEKIYHIAWGATLINVGLCLDIYGATKIIRSFFLKTGRDILKESGTYWGHNPNLTYSLLEQKIDAIFGGIFLFCGFILQLFGNNLSKPQGIKIDWLLTLVLVIFIFLLYLVLRKVFGRGRLSDYFYIILSLTEEEIENQINNLKKENLDKDKDYQVIRKYFDKKENDIEIIKKQYIKIFKNPEHTILIWPFNNKDMAKLLRRIFKI